MKKKPQSTYIGPDGRTLQPIELDVEGVVRFKANAIVRLLLDDGKYDMNRLAVLPFSQADREQFAQLIGYSVDGFGELSYASTETVIAADDVAAELRSTQCRNLSAPGKSHGYQHMCILPKGHSGPHRGNHQYDGQDYQWTWDGKTCRIEPAT